MSLSQVSRCLSCQRGISLEMLLPHLAGAVTETAEMEDGRLRIWAHSGAEGAACRRCGQFSSRVHSRYRRRLADAPVGGHPVVLWLGCAGSSAPMLAARRSRSRSSSRA